MVIEDMRKADALKWLEFLDPVDFDQVAQAYDARHERQYFQHPQMNMDAAPPPGKRLDIGQAVAKLVKENDITFIGEDHFVLEEPLFEKIIASSGAASLAVEFPKSMQKVLNAFLKTGSTTDPVLSAYIQVLPANVHLWQEAKKAGLNVVAVDADPPKTMLRGQDMIARQIQREKDLVANLSDLAHKGKVVTWLGAGHGVLNLSRVGLHGPADLLARGPDKFKVASVKLESLGEIEACAGEYPYPVQMNQAYATFFPEAPPSKSFALATSEMGGMRGKVLSDLKDSHATRWLSYQKTFNLAVFLTPADSQVRKLPTQP